MSEAKGHGRRWKFQMEPFRQKASQGYEELVRWIEKEPGGRIEEIEDDEKQKSGKNKPEKKRGEKTEKESNDFEDNLDMKSPFSDDNAPKTGGDFVVEVDSDQDLFSDSDGENGQKRKPRAGREPLPIPKVKYYKCIVSLLLYTNKNDCLKIGYERSHCADRA